ncbi:MAG TPA: ATP-binding protein [Kofleriaceae bacterium]|nr:ATP-binding protein [Kofleriaceae bacterium]
MNEVSCRIFEIFEQPLEAKGLSPELMVANTGVSLARLRNKKERIAWAEFAQVMHNLRPHFSDDEFRELGRTHMRSPSLRFAFVIGRLLFSVMDFYRWFNKPREGIGNQLFTCVISDHREISSNEIELDLTLPDGYDLPWNFFLTASGNMEELPRLLGLPRSTVTLTKIAHGGRFRIVMPQRMPLLVRLWRLITSPFTVRSAARELKEAHETLLERFLQIEDAQTKLDRQATQLRIAHAVNKLVQSELDLARTLSTVVKALVEEAGFAWAEITLRDVDPDITPTEIRLDRAAARRAAYGKRPSDGLFKRTLEGRGGELIGDLKLATKPGADRAEREELIAFIAPTLAVALQNALSYQALADYRSGLEQLVDQRTSELRQARDELAGTVGELREAQGARERFFSNITHEIRTPLSLILLAAADIRSQSGDALDERARGNLGAVTDAAHRLMRLVDELLLLAAGQEDKLRPVPERTQLGSLIGKLVAAWQPAAASAGLQLVERIDPTLVAHVDPVALERVASNLVSNAIKYTPRGGEVIVELVASGDELRLAVLDTGPGIGEDLHGRLFGRFERAHGDAQRKMGTGLGLFVAKQLVEAHGGTITAIARDPGPGSELRVVLPAALIARDAPAATTTSPALRLVAPDRAPRASEMIAPIDPARPALRLAPAGFSNGTILLAEDDTRLAETIARVLSDEFTVIVAHDGAAALALVPAHHPQLLITDIDMPGLNGIELSRKFRELANDRLAPIILLSAMIDLGTRLTGLDAGAVDYVTKPFDPLELRARIRAQFRMRDLAVRLQRAEQLTAMGILTAGLAHELRNPANGIVNAVAPLVDLLPRELTRPETAVGQLLDVLTSCADQIGFLSRQLLGFRKGVVDLDLRQIAVRDLLQRAVSLVHASTAELRIEASCEGTIRCAPPLIMQVLTNLLENAAHAAGPKGWIALRASARGDRLVIEVADSGGGVAPALRERVFEPFFTTKPSGVGTGLGLSLARDIVHRHGGVLEIRDRDDRGCFVVELPHYSPLDRQMSIGMMPMRELV